MGETAIKIHTALADANIEYSAYSSNGINIFGDAKSIEAARVAFHSHGQIDDLKTNLRHWRDECGKLNAKIAAKTALTTVNVLGDEAGAPRYTGDDLADAAR